MKIFEELENDLRDVNGVKGLGKLLLANGVENINVGKEGIIVLVTPFGLMENIPQENWVVDNVDKWGCKLSAKFYGVSVYCDISYNEREEFVKATGFVIPEVNADESK